MTVKGEWIVHESVLTKEYKFLDYSSAVDFIAQVSKLANKQEHHPDILLHDYNRVKIMLTTHSQGRVTNKDLEMARLIDKIVFT